MSILAKKTEERAIELLAECIVLFEKLEHLEMTAQDGFDARTPENLLRTIVENNSVAEATT